MIDASYERLTVKSITKLPSIFKRITNTMTSLVHSVEEVQEYLNENFAHTMELYGLAYRHHNNQWIYLQADAQQHEIISAADAQYWYRAVTEKEWEQINRNHRFYGESYGGIAPAREYVREYFTNRSDGTRIVEFSTPGAGFLYNYFRDKGLPAPKAEGGGTYGLGPTGHRTQNGEPGEAGALFNNLLARQVITWEVVDMKIPNGLPQQHSINIDAYVSGDSKSNNTDVLLAEVTKQLVGVSDALSGIISILQDHQARNNRPHQQHIPHRRSSSHSHRQANGNRNGNHGDGMFWV